jgi:hypothetical protein
MKNTTFIRWVLVLFFLLISVNLVLGETKSKKFRIHPTFKHLLITQPRKSKIVNPMVPRMSAQNVLQLYVAKKAIIFAVAQDNLNLGVIDGAIPLNREKEMAPSVIKKLKKIKNKYIILYCS